MIASSDITLTDIFAGAGGFTTGAKVAGAWVRLALNHWNRAIETHAANHPETDHDLCDLLVTDPARYFATTGLIASPECKAHTNARGKSRKNAKQLRLLYTCEYEPSEVRSRATMWEVLHFLETFRYQFVVVENVVEALKWEHFDDWLRDMRNVGDGYEHKLLFLNSMFFPPTPQSRDRMYIVFWRKGNRAPDLTFTPPAFCPTCDRTVEAVQSWKKLTNQHGKYGRNGQYVYRCPQCASEVKPGYFPAMSAIDWSIPTERIGDRKKPLKEKTLARIQYGIDAWLKRGAQAFAMSLSHDEKRAYSLTKSLPTQTGRDDLSLVTPVPFIMQNHDDTRTYDMEHPAPTMTSFDHLALVEPSLPPAWLARMYQGVHTLYDVRSHTTGTITSVDHHVLVTPPAFLTKFYGTAKRPALVTDAMPTQLANEHFGLVNLPTDTPITIEECGFRMLEPDEIRRVMAFPDGYQLIGSRRDRVKMLGNAVTPPVAEWIVRRCIASLEVA